jgi:hypothetical protein
MRLAFDSLSMVVNHSNTFADEDKIKSALVR